MKKLSIAILAIITLASCTKENKEHPKDYLTISGKFDNNKDAFITIKNKRKDIIKEIKFNEDGTFKDTLKVIVKDVYFISTNSKNKAPIHLDNGYNLTLNGDSNNFLNSFKYTGNGADSNNFIISQFNFNKKALGKNPRQIFALEKEQFKIKVRQIALGIDSVTNIYKNVDSILLANSKMQKNRTISFFNQNYDKIHKLLLEKKEKSSK
ncbi:MAG: hypothetical protein ACPGUU_01485 [Flavobacteriaceae bacterium]